MKLEVWQSIMHKPEKFFPIIQTGGLAVNNIQEDGKFLRSMRTTEIWQLLMPKTEVWLWLMSMKVKYLLLIISPRGQKKLRIMPKFSPQENFWNCCLFCAFIKF